jgi:hypothetical protein
MSRTFNYYTFTREDPKLWAAVLNQIYTSLATSSSKRCFTLDDQDCQTFRISRKISGFWKFFRFPNIFYRTNYVSVVDLYFRKFKWFYRGSALSSIGLLKDQSFSYVLLYGKTSILWTSSGLFKSVHYTEVFTSRGFTA